jgi:hypothetical protein
VIPNFRPRHPALPLQVLRFQSNAREGKQFIAAPERGVALDHDVGMQMTFGSEDDIRSDDAVGPDDTGIPYLGAGMNDGGVVDGGHARVYRSTTMNVISASLTGSAST